MEAAARKTILRIELWHGSLLLILLAIFRQTSWVEPRALLVGGLFVGVNFLLLSLGVAWVLTPLASKGRAKVGISLLVLKIAIFLGLLITLFYGFDLDPLSFAVGFSTLIVAIFLEVVLRAVRAGT
jgi:Kef-type K+ transport system membrane component KefB